MRCAGVIEMVFEIVMTDVVGMFMMVAIHGSAIIQVAVPYSTRRPYIPRESENHDRQKLGARSLHRLTKPERTSAEEENGKLK
jgi:hypothetical protein